MKKDFPEIMKALRLELHPIFASIKPGAEHLFDEIESKKAQMLQAAGYTVEEFDSMIQEYFLDFSSENPDEWIIRHDPEHAGLILKKGGTKLV